MKITHIDQTSAKEIRTIMEAAFAKIAESTGVHIALGRISYDPRGFTAKTTGVVGASKADAQRQSFEKDCYKVGLKSSDFGREIMISGTKMAITGVNTRAYRFPVSVTEVSTKKKFKISRTMVKAALAA